MGAINSKILPLTLFSLPDGAVHLVPPVVTPKCAPVLTARQAGTTRTRPEPPAQPVPLLDTPANTVARLAHCTTHKSHPLSN